jgi:phosphotransferase family enzyme
MSDVHGQIMNTANERDRYRLVVPRKAGSEILVMEEAGGFSLPDVEIPKWERIAPHITRALKNRWNLEGYCLSTPGYNPLRAESAFSSYQIVEPCRPDDDCPAGTRWVLFAALTTNHFSNSEDYRVIQSAIDELKEYARGIVPGPFAKPGFLFEVMDWAQKEIAPLGLTVTGPFCQLNASPTFSLIRFETDGPALWFKAVGEPNLREFSITRNLSQMFPTFLPRIIATQRDWNAWLTTETPGMHPDEGTGIGVWKAVVQTLADLQIASFGRTFRCIDAGCTDVRICTLVELVDPFLEVMTELMGLQTTNSPAPLSRNELLALGVQLKDALADSKNCEIPNALNHLDFNPGNIIVSEDRCTFLDWAEAAVGPPFLTFRYLVEHLRRLRPHSATWEEELLATYTRNWRPFAAPAEITDAVARAPLLALFACAVAGRVWRDPVQRCQPNTAKSLRSLTRRMKCEVNQWATHRGRRSVPCLN